MGLLKNTTFTFPCSLPIKWSDSEVDILGIHIPKEYLTTIQFNIKLDQILLPWKSIKKNIGHIHMVSRC